MKKPLYTMAFAALLVTTSLAQQDPKTKETKPAKPAATSSAAAQEKTKDDKGGTRMAITEKGLPAPKSKETKKEQQK